MPGPRRDADAGVRHHELHAARPRHSALTGRTTRSTCPSWVNFRALSTRLVRTWNTRPGSPMTICGTRGSSSHSNGSLLPSLAARSRRRCRRPARAGRTASRPAARSGLDPGEVEHGFHEGQQQPAVPVHLLQELELDVVQRGVLKDLPRGEHGGQRRADLVTHVGQEHRLRLRGRQGGIAGDLQLLCQGLEVADATGPLHGDPCMRGERLEDLDVLGPERLLLEGPVTHHQHVPGETRSSQRAASPSRGVDNSAGPPGARGTSPRPGRGRSCCTTPASNAVHHHAGSCTSTVPVCSLPSSKAW